MHSAYLIYIVKKNTLSFNFDDYKLGKLYKFKV